MSKEYKTIYPTIVGIECLKIDEGFSTQLVIVGDDQEAVFVPTDIFEPVAKDAIKKTLIGSMNMWSVIASMVTVYDSKTSEIIETVDLNDLYSSIDGVELRGVEIGSPVGELVH